MIPFRNSITLTTLILISSTLDARNIKVAGSDYIPPILMEALQEFAASEGDELEFSMGGSLLAFRSFYEGNADIILVAMPNKTPEDLDFPVFPIGFQTGVIVVHRDNPIKSLTRRQIGGIYGSLTENAIARWSQLGAVGALTNRNIQPGYANSGSSPILDLFSARFLENNPIRQNIQEFDSTIQLEAFISNNNAAIGIMDVLPLSTDLKAIQIQSEDQSVSFGPTLENVNYGDYPLTLEYYVCVPRSQIRFLSGYVDFLLSDSAAAILQEEGFYPILRSRRLQLANELPQSE